MRVSMSLNSSSEGTKIESQGGIKMNSQVKTSIIPETTVSKALSLGVAALFLWTEQRCIRTIHKNLTHHVYNDNQRHKCRRSTVKLDYDRSRWTGSPRQESNAILLKNMNEQHLSTRLWPNELWCTFQHLVYVSSNSADLRQGNPFIGGVQWWEDQHRIRGGWSPRGP